MSTSPTTTDSVPVLRGRVPEVFWLAKTGLPLEGFAGKCALAAHAAVRTGFTTGRERYGAWTGPVHPQSPFAMLGGFRYVSHAWVELPDGNVCDPTRWVFEHVEPYVYVGPNDHYDQGSDTLRQAMHGSDPFPSPAPEEATVPMELTTLFAEEMRMDVEVDGDVPPGRENCRMTDRQIFWLANRPIRDWKRCRDARIVMDALIRFGYEAYLPLDTCDAFDLKYETTGGDPNYKVPLPVRSRLTKTQKKILDRMLRDERAGIPSLAIYTGRRSTVYFPEYVATNLIVLYGLTKGKYPLIGEVAGCIGRYVLTEWGKAVARDDTRPASAG